MRNTLADLIVGVVVILVALWLVRRLFHMVSGAASMVLIVILVIAALRVAKKIRG